MRAFALRSNCSGDGDRSGNLMVGASMTAMAVAVLLTGTPAMAQLVPSPTGPSTNLPGPAQPGAADRPGGAVTVPVDGPPAAADPVPADGAPAEEEAITVFGFRAAVANAIAEKRNSDQILESISAEDIGKLPDNSIAESIARLPGVTAQRVDGRDQVISVRGSQPDFTTTLLNGREQVTTGDNRAVEFDQYPSELLGQVVVYKTPSAGLIGQGVSGTIDLRTIRPLGYGQSVIAVSARGELVTNGALNADTSNKGFRVSGIYVGQFMDDTLGITLGAAHIDSPTQYERYNAWGYPTFDCASNPAYQAPGGGCAPAYAAAEGNFVLGGAKPFVQSNQLKRTGVVGTVEWAPVPEWTTTVDAFYTKFNEQQQLRGIELPLAWGNAILQPGYTVEDGIISSATWTNVKGVLRNDYVERDADIISLGFNTAYTTGPLTMVLDASYSHINRNDIYLEVYAGTSRGAGNGPYDTLTTQVQPNGITTFTSQLDYTDPNLIRITSPQGWADGPRPIAVPGGQDGFYSTVAVEDELYAIRGSAQYDLGDGNTIEVGGNFTGRRKTLGRTAEFIAATVNATGSGASLTVPQQYLQGITNLSYLGIPGQISYDSLGLLRDGQLTRLEAANEPTELNSWGLTENVLTGWVRGNFSTPVGTNGTFSGNIGTQVVYTDQSSSGFRTFNNVDAATPIEDGARYTEILPSLNLSMRFDDNDVLRVGVARTLARARMDQLRASFSFFTNPAQAASTDPINAFFSAGGGNARLRPWIADGVDISYEHYFSRVGYFAIAGFYKYLETYIFDSVEIFDFTGTPTTGLPTGVTAPGTFLGARNQPVNGTGGELYGVEVSGTVPFELFSEALTGFGVLGSYSMTETNIQANPGNPAQPLPGFSRHVANGTAFFERDGFSARASVRYRSSFLAEVISLGPGARNRQSRPETIVDAQIGYEFQSGPLQGLGILAQGQNLTNAPFVTEDSGNGLVIDNQNYGRRFLAGVSYRF